MTDQSIVPDRAIKHDGVDHCETGEQRRSR